MKLRPATDLQYCLTWILFIVCVPLMLLALPGVMLLMFVMEFIWESQPCDRKTLL